MSKKKTHPNKVTVTSRLSASKELIIQAVRWTVRHLHRALWASGLVVVGLLGAAGSVSANTAFPAVFDVSNLNGNNGFTVSSTVENISLGRTVSGAGDVNDDGVADFIIGAPGAARPPGGFAKGQAYIIFGAAGGFPTNLDVSTIDGHIGFSVTGVNQLAESVSSAGDINHDGIDDVIISEMFVSAGLIRNGRAFVVFGRNTLIAGDFPTNINVPADLNGSNGFEIIGAQAYDIAGASVSGAGDINGDGIDDLIIGAPHDFFSPTEVPGRAYVLFGRDTRNVGNFPKVFDLTTLDGQVGFTIDGVFDGDGAGNRVSDVGDINGDGVDDVIIGTSFQPRTYIVFGRNTASGGDFPASLNLADLNGINGFVITGDRTESVGAAGDINDDGIDDLILGMPARSGPSERGRAYIIYGKDTANSEGFAASFDLSELDGTNGFKIIGVPPTGVDGTGLSVAGVGDINDDDIDDVGIKNGPFGQDETYVVFGRDTRNSGDFPSQFDLTGLDGANGFVVRGTGDTPNGPGGPRVAGAGDVNDDGIDDLLIGSGEDIAYVVFGRSADVLPLIRSLGDINGDNTQDIAALVQDTAAGTLTATVKDAEDGRLINTVAFDGSLSPVSFKTLPDINSNGAPELVVLGTGSVTAEVRDSLTGQLLSTVDYNPNVTPFDLAVVPDQDGNGAPELAVVGKHPTKAYVVVETRDALTGQQVAWTSFGNSFTPQQLVVLPDVDGNGQPEFAVMLVEDSAEQRVKVSVRNSDSTLVQNIWLGKVALESLDMAVLDDMNGNGTAELAILRSKPEKGWVSALITDGLTGAELNELPYNINFTPQQLAVVPDFNGNGRAELGVLGRNPTNSRVRVQIRDSGTVDRLSDVWFSDAYIPQDLVVMPDISGNGVAELGMLGMQSDDGSLRTFIKDARDGNTVNKVDF